MSKPRDTHPSIGCFIPGERQLQGFPFGSSETFWEGFIHNHEYEVSEDGGGYRIYFGVDYVDPMDSPIELLKYLKVKRPYAFYIQRRFDTARQFFDQVLYGGPIILGDGTEFPLDYSLELYSHFLRWRQYNVFGVENVL